MTKELKDQALHFSIGLLLTLLFSITLHIAASAFIVGIGVLIREGLQRIRNGDSFFKCGSGCMLDLLFWGIGISTAVLIRVFIIQ